MNICPYCGKTTEDSYCPVDAFPTMDEQLYQQRFDDNLVGQTLQDKYKIIGVLGQGGMGKVYKALQLNVKKWVAIKLMLKEYSADQSAVKRFYREVMASSRLSHYHLLSRAILTVIPSRIMSFRAKPRNLFNQPSPKAIPIVIPAKADIQHKTAIPTQSGFHN